MNLERVQLAKVMAAAEGAEIAKGDGRIPLRYFDSIVAFPEEARPLWVEANTDRMAAKMAKKRI